MKKLLPLILASLFLSVLILLNIFILPSHAQNDRCTDPVAISGMSESDLSNCLDTLNRAKNQSVAATAGVQRQIEGIKARVSQIENDLVVKQKNIDDGYIKLAKQTQIFNDAVRRDYIDKYSNTTLTIFLSGLSASDIAQKVAAAQAITNQNEAIITNIVLTVQSLKQQKIDLQSEQTGLAAVKVKLDKVVADAQAYQATLSSQIAVLSARQQEILASRLSALGIPLYASSAGSCSSDIGKNPNFSGSKFGFFTYGVRNRVGLNQYGAYGRAKYDNQSYDTILRAYYDFNDYGSVDENTTIRVNDSNGYDSGNIIWSGTLNQYIKRIWEVNENWPNEALKAQVIAIRSYVMAQTDNGTKSICANTHCQVFQTNEKLGGWTSAVDDTSGKVMKKDGETIVAYFSSTHGGYTHSSGGDISSRPWLKDGVDTSGGSISSWDDLKNNSYDRESPWFYCDWGARPEQNGTAWLKPEEVADIVNVILLVQKDPGSKEHLYQTDKPNPSGTDNWSADTVRQKLGSEAYTTIDNVSVTPDFSAGKTTNVTVSGNGKSNTFSADLFVTYFDLRAPATIYIPPYSDGSQKAPLFNVER